MAVLLYTKYLRISVSSIGKGGSGTGGAGGARRSAYDVIIYVIHPICVNLFMLTHWNGQIVDIFFESFILFMVWFYLYRFNCRLFIYVDGFIGDCFIVCYR